MVTSILSEPPDFTRSSFGYEASDPACDVAGLGEAAPIHRAHATHSPFSPITTEEHQEHNYESVQQLTEDRAVLEHF